jgi:hypothetical protein
MPPLTQSTTRALLESLGPERVERDHLLAPYTTFKIPDSRRRGLPGAQLISGRVRAQPPTSPAG